MKHLLNIVMLNLIFCCSVYSTEDAKEFRPVADVQMDTKNVMAQVRDLVIIRSFNSPVLLTHNSAYSYLEAYNIHTGDLVWSHQDAGMIVSFIIVDSKVIFRNYYHITALDVYTGAVLWTQQTKGEISTLVGE